MMQRPLLVTAWLLSFVNNVQSQWVQSGSLPLPSQTQALAISPDGSTIIASDGIYTLSKNVWTLTQPLYGLGSTIFLSYDGSIFISRASYLNVDIFSSSTTSPDTWNVISTIYGYSLGLDTDSPLTPSAATSDGKMLALVSIKCYNNATTSLCNSLIFILQSDNVGSHYILKQKLSIESPPQEYTYNIQLKRLSMSSDGSILALLWSNPFCFTDPSQQSPSYVSIYSRGSDGVYAISEQNFGDYSNWNDLTISSNGQILTAAVCDTQGNRAQFYSLIDGQYQSCSISFLGAVPPSPSFFYGPLLSISSDSSVIFVSVQDRCIILKQLNQTSWLQVQNIDIGQINAISFSSADGSTLVYADTVYSGPPSQVSATPSASSTASTLITATSTPTVTATSPSEGPSSISSSTLPQPATITISVLSTALTLISIALFVKWFSNYRNKLMLRADSSDRSENLLRVN